MAFQLTRRLQPLTGLIDLAPLVNVVLLLLFFFILSSSFVLQPGVKVDLPHVIYSQGTPTSRLIVVVTLGPPQQDAAGISLPRQPVLYFQDHIVTLDELKSALDQLALDRNSPPLVINADEKAPVSIITKLYDIANAHRPPLSIVIATQNQATEAAP